jgi:hypothetical protein
LAQGVQAAVTWPDTVEAILAGDHVLGLAYVTPASGVVITPVTNFEMQDREAGTAGVNSSIGAWKKLDRMRHNPRVALAFHTRTHATTIRPEYVLVQGTASFPWPPDRDSWYEELGADRWHRPGALPREVGQPWEWWMSVYHWRVNVTVAVERVLVWPDLGCRGQVEVHGAPPPPEPPAEQRPPKNGTGPRVNTRRIARRTRRLPHVLLGWVGADGFPMVVPVAGGQAVEDGVELDVAPGLVPPGSRRAGLTGHWFTEGVQGQEQRINTGWLAIDAAGRAVYAPHTNRGYLMPRANLIYKLAVGFETRRRLRAGRRAGVIPEQ